MAWIKNPSMGSLLVAALASLFVAGCGSASGEAPAFVGNVEGQDAVVGAVSDGERATFYLCGGDSTYETLTRWFTGSVAADGALDLSNAKGDWKVSGNLESGSGQITGDQGETFTWTAHAASGDVDGLYQVMDGSCRTGAVVGDLDGKGTTRLQGVWCDGEGNFAQVIPLRNQIELTAKGIEVTVQTPQAKQLLVTRVRQP